MRWLQQSIGDNYWLSDSGSNRCVQVSHALLLASYNRYKHRSDFPGGKWFDEMIHRRLDIDEPVVLRTLLSGSTCSTCSTSSLFYPSSPLLLVLCYISRQSSRVPGLPIFLSPFRPLLLITLECRTKCRRLQRPSSLRLSTRRCHEPFPPLPPLPFALLWAASSDIALNSLHALLQAARTYGGIRKYSPPAHNQPDCCFCEIVASEGFAGMATCPKGSYSKSFQTGTLWF